MSASQTNIQIDSSWRTAVVGAVVETFTSMVGLLPRAGQATFNSSVDVHADVSGIINLVQKRVEGTLVLGFPKETIFHILARIYPQPFNEVDRSVQEAVAEFTNIIYGTVKASLNKNGNSLQMVLPSVVIGDQHKVLNPKSSSSMLVPFEISGLPFYVQIHLHADSGGGSSNKSAS